ncbi:MAG TPA: LON peptidase substrate-binding domain-containing protein [Opitutaceae bacterium]|nr:LON peptidase substrate-binding domain-containing protein [Opitutaceae bacterium]
MDLEIHLPAEVPAMTLPHTVFFPQALLPLRIFEPRYRQMLRDVLGSHRLFAVARLDPRRAGSAEFEPAHRIATVGIVRACQENDDGTSNLLLQGLARVELLAVVREEPYRFVHLRLLNSTPGAAAGENRRLRATLARLIALKHKFGAPAPRDFTDFLKTVDDPETFVDLAAFSLCPDPAFKQTLLETLDIHRRLELFGAQVRAEIDAIKLRRKLQGNLPDDRISSN